MPADALHALDSVYTATEAAERLRLTKRAVIKLGKRHACCSVAGRNVLFSERDLLALWEALREPATSRMSAVVTSALRSKSSLEELRWMASRPPTKADRRVLGILRWLDRQPDGKTYKQIDRAGARTIEAMRQQGFVTECGVDEEGLVRVRIAPAGRDELKIAERWARKRTARGQNGQW